MSYILDALNKAERDRQHARVPTLATVHSVPVERRNPWPWIVGGALALNIAALGGFVILREPPAPPPPAPIAVAPRAVTTAAEATPPAPSAIIAKPAATVAAPALTPPTRTAATREDRSAREPEVLKLEVLIYSANPGERAVYINGQRYLEGQRVNERLAVERITSDSVVLAGKDSRQILKQQ